MNRGGANSRELAADAHRLRALFGPGYLSASMRFSQHSLALLDRLPDKSLQTKNMNLPTGRAAMIGGIFGRNDYVEMLPTPVAVNHHRDGEVPFMNG